MEELSPLLKYKLFMEDYYIPPEKSDPLTEDSLLEKVVWWGSIGLIYIAFIAMFLVSIIG